MKLKTTVLLTSLALGILVWILDATLGARLLFANITSAGSAEHRLFMRSMVLVTFTGFGLVLAHVVASREEAAERQTAAAERHRAAEQQVRHLNLVLKAVRHVNQLITREKDPQVLLQLACNALVETRGYATACIVVPRSDAPPLYASAGLGAHTTDFTTAMQQGRYAECFHAAQATGDVIVYSPDAGRVDCPLHGLPFARHAMTTRLHHAGRSWGVISVSAPPEIGAGVQERDLLQEIAGDLAFALHSMERDAAEKRAVSMLEASEQRYRALFEHAPIGIFQTTTDGRLITINSAASKMIGAPSREDALRQVPHIAEQLSLQPEDYAHVKEALSTQGQIRNFEFESRRLNGEPVWLSLDAQLETAAPESEDVAPESSFVAPESSFVAPDSHSRLINGFARDITARKQAEAALRESQRTLMTLMSNLPGMAYRCLDDPDWTLLFTSAGCRALTGYDPHDLIGNPRLTYGDLLHPEDHASVQAQLASGPHDRHTFVLEYRIRTAQGEEKWVLEQGQRILPPESDVPLLEGLILDVTDRHRAEEAREQLLLQVREQATQLEHLMDTVPEGVLLLDAGHRVMLANPAARRDLDHLAGITEGDVLTSLGDHTLESLLEPVETGEWHEVRSATRIFETIVKPVEGTHRERWVMVINDVTLERDRQQRSQRQDHLAAIGQLAAGIAHDFNNIIAVIVLYSQLAQRQLAQSLPAPHDPNARRRLHEQLATISEEARRATRLIEQILDFGRRTSLELRPMDLVPFLKEEVRLLQRTLPESIVVRLDYGREAYYVNADPARLQQVLMNLALNARDAMPEGGHLTIEVARLSEADGPPTPDLVAGEWIQVSVTDTGAGMPPEVRSRLFEPFFTTKGARGNGLGLAQVHGIVGQHEGSIDVLTAAGAGTTFSIYLPALAEPPLMPAAEGDDMPRGAGETILLVEDNDAVRTALTGALTELGYTVTEAGNGRQALDLLLRAVPDLVLSDLVMPEMGGRALLQALRQAGLNLPFVMLSGHATEAELEALHAEGLAGWLPKPPELVPLARLIHQALHPR